MNSNSILFKQNHFIFTFIFFWCIWPAVLLADLPLDKLDAPPAMWLRADIGVSHTGGLVNNWGDYSGNGRHATQANTALQPMLVEGALNGNPVIRFFQERLDFNGAFLANTSYTIFAVDGRNACCLNWYVNGFDRRANRSLHLGYRSATKVTQGHFANDLDALVPAFSGNKVFALTTFKFDMTSGRTIYRFGQPVGTDNNTIPLLSFSDANVGQHMSFSPYYFYNGDVAELIFFDTVLTECDRSRVESYLAEKYGLSAASDPFAICTGDLLTDLAADIIALNLQTGLSNSLDAKLTAVFDALTDLNENNDVSALNRLNAFINEVEAQRGKKITDAQADYLIAAVLDIIETI